MNRKQHLFQIDSLYILLRVFNITFDQLNAFLLNKHYNLIDYVVAQ